MLYCIREKKKRRIIDCSSQVLIQWRFLMFLWRNLSIFFFFIIISNSFLVQNMFCLLRFVRFFIYLLFALFWVALNKFYYAKCALAHTHNTMINKRSNNVENKKGDEWLMGAKLNFSVSVSIIMLKTWIGLCNVFVITFYRLFFQTQKCWFLYWCS